MGNGANEEMLAKGYKLAVLRLLSSGDLFYNVMTVVNNKVLCTWNLLRVDFVFSKHTHKLGDMMC